MHKFLWWQTLRSLIKVSRVIIFEKYGLFVFLLWWFMITVLALMVYWLDYRAAAVVLLSGLFLFPFFRRLMAAKKYLLLRNGDIVEYASQDRGELVQKFETARLLQVLPKEHVVKRGMFDEAYSDLYTRYYLIRSETENSVIPYEWILGIEAGTEVTKSGS